MKKIVYLSILLLGLGTGCEEEENLSTIRATVPVSPLEVKYLSPTSVDLDNDGEYDFTFTVGVFAIDGADNYKFMVNSLRGNQIRMADESAMSYEANYRVSGDMDFDNVLWTIDSGEMLTKIVSNNDPVEWSGSWFLNTDGYLAVSIVKDGTTFYGWIEINADLQNERLLITKYAWNSRSESEIYTDQIR